MAALAIAVVVSQFRSSYLERELSVQIQTEHYVKAMEAHVIYSIQSADLSLMSVSNAIKVLPARQSSSRATMEELLSSLGSSFDSDYWITFVDPKGNAVATSTGSNVTGISYADRDYFKVHANNEFKGKLFIGEPAIGKRSKKKLFFLSRRVESAKGEFLGVVTAPLNVDRYVKVFENSRFNSDISISLIHAGGKVIARVPNFEQAFARDLSATSLFDNVRRASSGTYKTVSLIDNVTRVFSYHVLDGLPLIIVVGSNDTEAARLLQQNYLTAGSGLAILLLLMFGAGHFSLRTYSRQEDRELRYRTLYNASREMERQLLANEESMKLASLLFQNSGEGMMVTDANGLILTVNPAFSLLSGYTEKELINHRAYELASSRNDREFFDRIFEAVTDCGHWKGELWHQSKDGEEYLVSMVINTVYNENGNPFRYVALLGDITQKKASEELIWRQANFDTLTGLANRRMFHEHLRLEMKKTDRSQLPMALVFVDLDYFKEINDTLGHDKGDMLLKQVATRLLSCVRSTDTVARLGGDEFTVILSELNNASDVVRIAQEILKKMSTPFHLGDSEDRQIAHISSSIGITLYPEDGADAETLIKNADQAMYTAKQQGRNRFNYFASFMQETTRARMHLVNELREALQHDQLRILYQPIIDLSNGAVVKAEALVRWQHPVRGLLNPAEFLNVAESSGLIIGIGDWVFHQAAREVLKLQAISSPAFQVSVNKSAWQFRDDGSNYRQWLDFLKDLKVSPQSIIVEVTENLLLEAASNNADLRHTHMQISLDDFGSGHCSVAFLKRFGVDYIKIAPEFVTQGGDGLLICEAMIAMAHKLGIKVIAEGIETQQQLAALTAIGCDFGQGYLLSRPISGPELEEKLQKQCEPVNK
ncbi:EAL domain-containing protein [Pseudoduganella sp. FT26W]|uniref:EAL domain-containing protein n=1 Tax=Duganella aquatilis TaxID=2666082 RepID=A0A844DCA2_9BURK|nr:EAL domain-containing protein [Duganella aquatilis]MRW84974.1 EAL domain-containing protein [Duganella aquatilis]